MNAKKEPGASRAKSTKKIKPEPAGAGKKKAAAEKKSRTEHKKIEALKQENETLRNQLLRTLAEMDNMRKRLEKERIQWQDAANADLLLAILPVVDDLERSLKTDQNDASFREGISLIVQKLNKTLADKGVSPMDAQGQPFDVDQHDALMQLEKEDVESGTVIEEYEKGYLLHGRVLRHAKVLVSK